MPSTPAISDFLREAMCVVCSLASMAVSFVAVGSKERVSASPDASVEFKIAVAGSSTLAGPSSNGQPSSRQKLSVSSV
ncbi:MAG: hypothetical protein WKF92_07150 [Pyrinomonadaceae bacterium]